MPLKYLRVNPDSRDVVERVNYLVNRTAPSVNFVNVKTDYGAKGDGVTDDTAAIQAAIDSGSGLVFFPAGIYSVSSQIDVPIWVSLYGVGYYSIIRPLSSGVFANDFIFVCNYSFSSGSWVQAYPGIGSGRISDLHFVNVDAANYYDGNFIQTQIGCIYAAGSYTFERIRATGVNVCIRSSGKYDDNVHIKQCLALRSQNSSTSDYLFEAGYLGDGLVIESILATFDTTATDWNTLKLSGTMGATINSFIGHNIYIESANSVIFNGGHGESGIITVDNSSVTFNTCCWYRMYTPKIVLTSTANSVRHVKFNDCEFTTIGYDGGTAHRNPNALAEHDIQIHGLYDIEINNTFRRYIDPSNIAKSEFTGIRLKKQDLSDFTAWNALSYKKSLQSHIFFSQQDLDSLHIDTGDTYLTQTLSSTTANNVTWQAATNTYYYAYQLIWDTTRMIGRQGTTTESSVALTNGGDGVQLVVNYGSRSKACIVRFYRGTATGVYDKYCDLHAIGAYLIYDDGDTVLGTPWVARTPGAVDSIFEKVMSYTVSNSKFSGIIQDLTTTPTAGAWTQGDRLVHQLPSAGGREGFICTASGSPGTWRDYGAIELAATEYWNCPNIVAGAAPTTHDITVTGATVGDYVVASVDTPLLGLQVTAEVNAADTVRIYIYNPTGADIDLVIATWAVRCIHRN